MGTILTKLGDQVPQNSKLQQNIAMVETAEENPEIDNKYSPSKERVSLRSERKLSQSGKTSSNRERAFYVPVCIYEYRETYRYLTMLSQPRLYELLKSTCLNFLPRQNPILKRNYRK